MGLKMTRNCDIGDLLVQSRGVRVKGKGLMRKVQNIVGVQAYSQASLDEVLVDLARGGNLPHHADGETEMRHQGLLIKVVKDASQYFGVIAPPHVMVLTLSMTGNQVVATNVAGNQVATLREMYRGRPLSDVREELTRLLDATLDVKLQLLTGSGRL